MPLLVRKYTLTSVYFISMSSCTAMYSYKTSDYFAYIKTQLVVISFTLHCLSEN